MKKISSGVVHTVPRDMRTTLLSSENLQDAWNTLTPLARNEWICWVISVKKKETRAKHITRMEEQLQKGVKRPCCWPGCPHRKK